MLSLTKGREIASITHGKLKGKTIKLSIDDDLKGGCCSDESETDEEIDEKEYNISPYDYITVDEIKKMGKGLNKQSFKKLTKSIGLNKLPSDDKLKSIYKKAQKKVKEKSEKEIYIEDGQVYPIPSEKSERIYICGPTGSGKSFFISQYIKLFQKKYPKMKIYIFSDVDSDEALDKFKNIVRVKLDESIVEKPIEASEFQTGSLIIFDDIDSIIDKKILQAVETLRDHILKRGRHENLYCLVSNHLSTDYKRTRVILNECSAVVVYPKSGSSSGISYLLSKYCGMNKDQINKVFSLNSRWVYINKNYPLYTVFNHGAYLI